MNTIQYVELASNIHPNYNYVNTIYINSRTKISVICQHHGEFIIDPRHHLRGFGCIKCYRESKNQIYDTIGFITKSNILHKNLYDYSLVNYTNAFNEVIVICSIHGEFKIKPNHHLNGSKCPKCKNFVYDNNSFINKANEIHHYRYNYEKVKYIDTNIMIEIICPVHGSYIQQANSHIQGCGCSKCKISKGELAIIKFLDKNQIKYQSQKRFSDCRNILPLPFDFYLPDYNTCIEFDGQQHFTPHSFNSKHKITKEVMINNHLKILLHDDIKNKYCMLNNINLIRINYWDVNKIDKILLPII